MEGFDSSYSKKIGVLITNLGTPDSPDRKGLRKYLNQFLSDRRVVDINRVLWFLILKLIILNIRPSKSAVLYKKIWTNEGSPLLVEMKKIVENIKKDNENPILHFSLGMRYGNPSVQYALEKFRKKNIYKILVLPLYPQAGSPTSSSTFDEVSNVLSKWPWVPNIRFINGYHDNRDYISSISKSISEAGNLEHLIFSFHGMPMRYLQNGDPYYCFCHKTVRLVAESLKLSKKVYTLAFQSRFGKEEWLKPYIDDIIVEKARQGVRKLHIISPGFSVDCLETLEEIKIQYSELFIKNGGKELVYIPCLNSGKDHVNMIGNLIKENIKGW